MESRIPNSPSQTGHINSPEVASAARRLISLLENSQGLTEHDINEFNNLLSSRISSGSPHAQFQDRLPSVTPSRVIPASVDHGQATSTSAPTRPQRSSFSRIDSTRYNSGEINTDIADRTVFHTPANPLVRQYTSDLPYEPLSGGGEYFRNEFQSQSVYPSPSHSVHEYAPSLVHSRTDHSPPMRSSLVPPRVKSPYFSQPSSLEEEMNRVERPYRAPMQIPVHSSMPKASMGSISIPKFNGSTDSWPHFKVSL